MSGRMCAFFSLHLYFLFYISFSLFLYFSRSPFLTFVLIRFILQMNYCNNNKIIYTKRAWCVHTSDVRVCLTLYCTQQLHKMLKRSAGNGNEQNDKNMIQNSITVNDSDDGLCNCIATNIRCEQKKKIVVKIICVRDAHKIRRQKKKQRRAWPRWKLDWFFLNM